MDSPLKEETPNIELPNDEKKLFDVDDDVGTSTIPNLSVPLEDEDEEEEAISNNVWYMPLILCPGSLNFILMVKVSEMG